MATIEFRVNDMPVSIETDPARTLLDVLRVDLGLTGTKQGCDYEGECGACTVLLDGRPVRSCLTPIGKVAGRAVLTVEGLARPEGLHPLQSAFIECGAVQCGYCTPGMLMSAVALLERTPDPSDAEIVAALDGNLCRCTGYVKIVDAVHLAAARMRDPAAAGAVGSSQQHIIGGSMLRADSIPKVTGAARYVEDIAMPGLLHGAVLRSPHHHARLRSLDTAAAARLPGVLRVLTADDVPGENGMGDYGQEEPVLPCLGATLRMVGAPIALVIGETLEAAQAGAAAIAVEYDVLPHFFEPADALAPGAVHIAGRDNLLTSYEAKHGDLEAALAASAVVVQAEYRTAFLEHSALEREALLGYFDEADRLTVVGGNHEPFHQQGYIAAALALPQAQVRVITPVTGGSFGGKQDPWPFVATALMVYHVRRPVRLVYSRRESFLASPKRHAYVIRQEVGATSEGKLTAIRVRVDCNTGAYDSGGQYIPNFAVTASGGPYRWQAVDAYAQSVYTNGPKAGQFRGFGTSQSTFATECTLDELAERLHLDPLELRRRNCLNAGEPSFLGYPVAETLGFREALQAIQPHYEAYRNDADAFNATQRPQRRGVGLAGMWYRFGKAGSLSIEAHAELARDGRFVIFCTAPDYGQGISTVMLQMAAEELGVSRDRIELVSSDTARVPDSDILGASRATYFVGGAVVAAARSLKQDIFGIAAELVDRPPSLLAISHDQIMAADGSVSVSLVEVASEFDRIGKPRRVRGFFDLSERFPLESRPEYLPLIVTGAHVAEVEVDLRTGQVQVLRMAGAHDVGQVVNPKDAEGQIEGAMLMGVGAALMEEVIPAHSTGFADYYLPTAQSMPRIDVMLVQVPSPYGAYGVKGLGEAPMLPGTPAIINAVSRAIGRRLREIPATPERVLRALRDLQG